MLKKPLLLIIVATALIISSLVNKEESKPPETRSPYIEQKERSLAAAVKNHAHKVWVNDSGKVVALLPDDTQGARHQRILIKLPGSNETVLIAHNIDLAPRINQLAKGDTISFAGEYIWNEKGGVLHWTHHDPQGHQKGGWIEFHGKKYQ